jgi:hypothetical protein
MYDTVGLGPTKQVHHQHVSGMYTRSLTDSLHVLQPAITGNALTKSDVPICNFNCPAHDHEMIVHRRSGDKCKASHASSIRATAGEGFGAQLTRFQTQNWIEFLGCQMTTSIIICRSVASLSTSTTSLSLSSNSKSVRLSNSGALTRLIQLQQ